MSALKAVEFKLEIDRGSIVVDTRDPAAFGGVHIRGAYSIWLQGLPDFAGLILPRDRPLLLLTERANDLDQAYYSLTRLGFDMFRGYLKGGIGAWYNAGLEIENLPLLSVHRLKNMLDKDDPMTLLDTRGDEEWRSGHIGGAIHIYVGQLQHRLDEVPRDKPVIVYCQTGHRAGIGASILLREGYTQVSNVPGSITAWIAAGFPLAVTH